MAKLGVNIDHVATLRQARHTVYPDILEAALAAEKGGADGITVHLREDRRHIQDDDVYLLKERINTKLNLEMSLSEEIVKVALEVRPQDVCLVPEKREELTTEGGLDVVKEEKRLLEVVSRLKAKDIRVSLFIDPVAEQIQKARKVGAEFIELHTGKYADTHGDERASELVKIRKAVTLAKNIGLRVNAGHGLNYENVRPVAHMVEIEELNIGHSIVAEAVFVGLEEAVWKMKKLVTLEE